MLKLASLIPNRVSYVNLKCIQKIALSQNIVKQNKYCESKHWGFLGVMRFLSIRYWKENTKC
jgi:hypothetical protein